MVKSTTIDTSNLHLLAEVATVFFDELELSKKGKSKIVDERVTSFFDCVPRKARSSLKNVNGVSTSSSSSSLFLNLNTLKPCSLTFKKTKNPLNPLRFETSSLSSCVTEQKKRRKRRVLEEKKCPGKEKKAKVVHLSWKGREIPHSLLEIMRRMNVFEEPKLIFEKSLYATDVNPGESRLSMPINQIFRNDFLTSQEVRFLEEDINNPKKLGFGAILVDQRGTKWGVFVKRWESQTNGSSWLYTLTCGWNDAVAANGLKEDDGVSVWTFRYRGLLCFALVSPPQKGESSSSSVTQ